MAKELLCGDMIGYQRFPRLGMTLRGQLLDWPMLLPAKPPHQVTERSRMSEASRQDDLHRCWRISPEPRRNGTPN
jgi:hypothetical protein